MTIELDTDFWEKLIYGRYKNEMKIWRDNFPNDFPNNFNWQVLLANADAHCQIAIQQALEKGYSLGYDAANNHTEKVRSNGKKTSS